MADSQRLTVDKLVLHHAVTPTWEEKSKAQVAQWFSDNGFVRGYGSNAANWSGLINPYSGARSYSMAHLAGQRVNDSTPDATPAERAAGYRLIELVQDIWGQITWNAGNWPVNQSCIGIENLGDYRTLTMRDGDMRVIADFWRPHDAQLGGQTAVYGHEEVSQLGTQCPASIMNARDQIVAYINTAPAPVAPPAPVQPAPAPAAPASPYVRFDQPLNLQYNKQPTNVYNLTGKTWADLSANVVKTVPAGEPFVAVGKYTHPLSGVYFMTAYSFGSADKTGNPDHPYGVNTVDLSPAPTQTSAPQQIPASESAPLVDVHDSTQPQPETPASVATDDGGVAVPVKVVPADPNKWQQSFKHETIDMVASQSVVVHDQSGNAADLQLVRGQVVHVGGTFEKDGVTYYRTQKSVTDGTWYGIPEKQNAQNTLVEDDSLFTLGEDVLHTIGKLTLRDKIIRVVASVVGFFTRKKKA